MGWKTYAWEQGSFNHTEKEPDGDEALVVFNATSCG